MKTQEYDYKLIGSHIKKSRKSKKYTQDFLANKIGVGGKHISNIECGNAGISIDILIKLCKTLDVGADYILFGKVTADTNNPFNILLDQLTPQKLLQAEKVLDAFVKSCLDK